MLDIIIDAIVDSAKLFPFLFITYLAMEWAEHKIGHTQMKKIKKAEKSGPIWGALLGIIPQCGFSAAASSLYAGRVITIGTLLAIYLSTSDEMLPILISASVDMTTIMKIIFIKVTVAAITGLIIELFLQIRKKNKNEETFHVPQESKHCSCCHHGIFVSALEHAVKILIYIFMITLILNICIYVVGENALSETFMRLPILDEVIAAFIGLIPNCASSVVITELYMKGVLGSGAMMSGLLVNAGVGLLVLLRLNHKWKQNMTIVAILYGSGVFWGSLIELLGIVF